jgi:hypothetical protein
LKLSPGLLKLLWSRKTRPYGRYRLAEAISGAIYPDYVFSEYARSWLDNSEFMALYDRYTPGNRHSADRKFFLNSLLELIANVPGDTAECGVFEGASSVVICEHVRRSNGQAPRTHHAIDSFEGLSEPATVDGTYWSRGSLTSSRARATANLAAYPNVKIHAGWIPQVFNELPAQARFAFLHVDVDLFQPTLDTLDFFYERLNRGAVVVCDDYGFSTCPGATAACDQFLAGKPEKIVHAPTGQGFFIKS